MSQLYPSLSFDNKVTCDIFSFARQNKLPFSQSFTIANSKFELIHLTYGDHYPLFQSITTNVFSQSWMIIPYLCGILLKTKSDVSAQVNNIIIMIETQYKITHETIRTDNGPKFFLTSFYDTKGITCQSCVDTPH